MDNRDFDNIFKNQLEGLPEKDFLFEENSWNEVEGVLAAEGILPSTKRNWKGFLPLFLVGMLLFSNMLVGWKYYNSEQEIILLNSEIQNLKSSNTHFNNTDNQLSNNNNSEQTANNLLDNDPEIKIVERIVKEIVYVPIYSSKFSNKNNTLNNDNNIDLPSNPSLNTNNYNNPPTNDLSNQDGLSNQGNLSANSANTRKFTNIDLDNQNNIASNNTNNSNQNEQSSSTNDTNTLTTDNENNTLIPENIINLDLISLTEVDNPIKPINQSLENIIDTTAYQHKLKFKDYLTRIGYATEVSNFEIGLSGGLDVLYQTTDFKTLSTRYGITSEITFYDRVKLGTTIDLKETKGELDNIAQGYYSDEYFDDYPDRVPLNPNDELNKIETKDRAIEFSVFAKYLIQPHNKFSPYFGFGIKGEYDYQQRFEYKYLNDFGYEYELDYVYTKNKQLGFNTLLGLTGVQYELSPSINVSLEAMYNYDYKTHRFDDSQMNWFSTNIGILYKFQ